MRGQRSSCIPDAVDLVPLWRGCDHADWATPAAELFANGRSSASSRVMINVGANKGFNAAAFLALWSARHRDKVQAMAWFQAIRKYALGGGPDSKRHSYLSYQACGACRSCQAKDVPPHQREGGIVHLLELLPANRALLRWLIGKMGLGDAAKLHDLAASNVTRLEPAPSDVFAKFAGSEYKSLSAPWFGRRAARKYNGTMQVVALDDLIARAGLRDVFLVDIDTEGWDALVLEGMRRTLSERRVTFVEFEYSGRGALPSA